MRENHRLQGHLLAMLTVLVWGTTFVSTKVLLRAFTPLEIMVARFGLGFVALFAAGRGLVRPQKWQHELLFALAGLTGVSLYFLGITLGRFLSGFASMRMKSAALIRLGQLVSAGGAVLLMLPLPAGFGVAAMAVLGLGFAPVYPSMIHETPYRFGAERSQAVIGLQMACAYVGTTFMPALFGVLAARLGIGLLPAFLLAGVAGMLLCAERVRTLCGR